MSSAAWLERLLLLLLLLTQCVLTDFNLIPHIGMQCSRRSRCYHCTSSFGCVCQDSHVKKMLDAGAARGDFVYVP